MNRFLHWFNLAGVLALALLCVVQWRLNRQLNLELNAAEKARQQQAARLGAEHFGLRQVSTVGKLAQLSVRHRRPQEIRETRRERMWRQRAIFRRGWLRFHQVKKRR